MSLHSRFLFFQAARLLKSRAGLWIILLPLLCPSPVSAQKITPKYRRDSHVMRYIVNDALSKDDQEPQILTHPNELWWRPDRTLVVVLGRVDHERNERGEILRFISHPFHSLAPGLQEVVRAGGSVLIATDQQLHQATLARLTGYIVEGGRVVAGENTPRKDLYEEKHRGLLVVSPDKKSPQYPLMKNLRVVTNESSFLTQIRFRRNNWVRSNVLARLPEGCERIPPRGEFALRAKFQRPPVFAVTAEHNSGGRVLLVADHSVFINEMMYLRLDVENAVFADRAVNWLCGEGRRRRNRVLFVVDGRIETKLAVPLYVQELSVDAVQVAMTRFANRNIALLQEEWFSKDFGNTLNEEVNFAVGTSVSNALGGRRARSTFFSTILLGATLFILLYGFHRLRGASWNPDLNVPLLAKALRDNKPHPETMLQRQQAILNEGDLSVYARQLARECLASVIPISAKPTSKPVVEAEGSQQRRFRRLARRIWDLAFGENLPSISRRRFRRVLGEISMLEEALRSGQVRLVV